MLSNLFRKTASTKVKHNLPRSFKPIVEQLEDRRLLSGFISTFDTGSEGWRPNAGGSLSYVGSGGNPGGYIRMDDTASFPNYGVVTPVNYFDSLKNNLSAFNGGTISFDNKILLTGTNVFDSTVGFAIISSPFGTATSDLIPDVPPTTWKTYSSPLTASLWGKTDSEWTSILSNVTSIEIQLEAYTGPDATGFDNFKLQSALSSQAVPEPASLTLLGLGSLSLLCYVWRRRKAVA
jgi:hypothetical protein